MKRKIKIPNKQEKIIEELMRELEYLKTQNIELMNERLDTNIDKDSSV